MSGRVPTTSSATKWLHKTESNCHIVRELNNMLSNLRIFEKESVYSGATIDSRDTISEFSEFDTQSVVQAYLTEA